MDLRSIYQWLVDLEDEVNSKGLAGFRELPNGYTIEKLEAWSKKHDFHIVRTDTMTYVGILKRAE